MLYIRHSASLILTLTLTIMLHLSPSIKGLKMLFQTSLISSFQRSHRTGHSKSKLINIVKMSSATMSNGEVGGRVSAAVKQQESSSPLSNSKKKTVMDLNPVKGTRDFYPEDQRLKTWLFNKWRNTSLKHGFEEYDAPVVESEELYIRKAGEEVSQQLYNFEDKGGRRLSLRPEMTPSLARMVLSRKGALAFPLKWFSIPQCWRYERMTRGRRREHYQWNMDIWGVAGIEAEAELLSALVSVFIELGIDSKDVGIKVNSRKILTGLMENLGIPETKWAATCVLIDKLEKVPIESIQGDLEKLGLDTTTVKNLVDILKLKDFSKIMEKLGPKAAGVVDIENLFKLADAYGFKDWLEFDATVVRGLAYYTGIVFEGFDRKGELRAICGGGRYDNLLESMGGDPLPAVGFGFGDAVIMELLTIKKCIPPEVARGNIDVVVFAMEDSLHYRAVSTATQLRNAGFKVDLILENKKPKWVFQRADKIGAASVVMFGTNEAETQEMILKELATGTQTIVNNHTITDAISSIVQRIK